MKYEWKNEATRLLKMLRMSEKRKEQHGWSRNVSAGFIAEDIKEVILNEDKTITVITEAFTLTQKPIEYNLRETQELIKWLEKAKP